MPMLLESLSLSHFRNIEDAAFFPHPELTVICGNNGQGKTNLLEAVWLMTGGKSFRGSKDVELIQKNQEFSLLHGSISEYEMQPETKAENMQGMQKSQDVDAQDTQLLPETQESRESQEQQPQESPEIQEPLQRMEIDISIGKPNSERPGRQAKKNGVPLGRATLLAGSFPAVVFAPTHLSLVKGSPDGRRRFVDAALCQLYPNYLTIYRRYAKALAQKNAYLKKYPYAPEKAAEDILLDTFDVEIIRQGEEIQKRRLDYLALLTPLATQFYAEISNGAEAFDVKYLPQFKKGYFAEKLKDARSREIAARCCLIGPHREDLELQLNGEAAKIFASQGQQRSAVLSLKLAEAAVTYDITGKNPVMLLDDVLSELDEHRKKYLLTRMEGKQVFVTSCEESSFTKTNGKIVFMEHGVLKES